MNHCDYCGDHLFPIVQVCCTEGQRICVLCCSKNQAFNPGLHCAICERSIGNKKYILMKNKANQFFTTSRQAYYSQIRTPLSLGNSFLQNPQTINMSSQQYPNRGGNFYERNNEMLYHHENFSQPSIYRNNHQTPRNKSPTIYTQNIHKPYEGNTIRYQNEAIRNCQQNRVHREIYRDQTMKKMSTMEIENQYEDQIGMNQFYTNTLEKKKQKNVQETVQYNHHNHYSSNYRSKYSQAKITEKLRKRGNGDYSYIEQLEDLGLRAFQGQRYIEKQTDNFSHKGKFIASNQFAIVKEQNQSPDFNRNNRQDVVSFGQNRSNKSPTFRAEKDTNNIHKNYSPSRITRSKSYCVIPNKHSK